MKKTALFALVVTLVLPLSAATPTAKPEEVGLSADRLKRVSELVQRHLDAKSFSGAVTLVARNGRIGHFEAHGLMDIESNKPMQKDSIFRIMSMTKPVVGVSILMLIEEGKVRLTDPVSKWIPELKNMTVAVPQPGPAGPPAPAAAAGGPPPAPRFYAVPAERDITVRDLLTHTSGLGSGTISNYTRRAVALQGQEKLSDFIPRLGRTVLEFQPGTRWAYSAQDGFDVLARVVEIVSGLLFADQFAKQRIFDPLGMKDTYFYPAGNPRVATNYTRQNGELRRVQGESNFINGAYFSGGGGLFSTPEDYLQFGLMLVNGGQLNGKRLLAPRTVEMMGSIAAPDTLPGRPTGESFGLSVRVVNDPMARNTFLSPGSFGWSGAFGTHFWVDPKERLVAVVMTQTSNQEFLRDFENMVMQAVVGNGTVPGNELGRPAPANGIDRRLAANADPDTVTTSSVTRDRRRLLKLLAASPLLPYLGLPDRAAAMAPALAQEGDVIATAAEALSVLDFEAVAKAKLPPWHWAWLSTGGDDGATIRANRDGFEHYQLRARRLIDVSKLDTSTPLFGRTYETPIFLSPLSGHKIYNPQGELATARAARARKHLQLLSTMTTTGVEDVIEARGEPVWFQLYHRDDWGMTRQLLRRVEAAGCPALVFTVDLLGGRNMEQFARVQQKNAQTCVQCHVNGQPLTDLRNRPMLTALTAPETRQPEIGTPTWDYIKRLRDATGMKLLIKGIVTREDAELAIAHGVNGIYISNHGGRAENSLRPTIQCVADVAAGVRKRVPILVDGGFRRGTDVFKALALGATAVGIGRPYIWGLSAFGQEGVEAVLAILRRELELIMRQSGTTSIGRITAGHVVPAPGWR